MHTRLPRGTEPSGPTVAERRFELPDSPGRHAVIRVRKPTRDPRTGNYRCSVEWIRPEERELFELWGIDSAQALQLALRAAGDLVNAAAEKLRWVGGEAGYLGFPKTYPEHLPKVLLQKLERLIDRELSAHTQKLAAAHKQHQRQRPPPPARTKRPTRAT
ncbi:DUF6968 family protein [Hyalangium rubrum]|uniref:DUF6968 family protein n=1 Tax=Hyalangium rubrum TaxID=3103134 RepID=UPI003BF45F39